MARKAKFVVSQVDFTGSVIETISRHKSKRAAERARFNAAKTAARSHQIIVVHEVPHDDDPITDEDYPLPARLSLDYFSVPHEG